MIHAEETLKLKRRLNEIYVKHTGQTLKRSRRRWSATASCPRGLRRSGA